MVVISWSSLLALGFATSALAAQPLIAEALHSRDLEIRQDSSKCPGGGYMSANGMNFTTQCGYNNPFNDAIPSFKSPSMFECMERCSRFWGNGEGCFGVVWVEAQQDCWIRNSTVSTKGLVKTDGHYSALVVQGNLDGVDTTCPGEDKSVQTLSGVEGLKYTINCNKVIGGSDACWSGYPNCLPNPFQGFYHTKTLEECLRKCVDEHPLCKAVSWNPDMKIGFANCWPKTDFPNLSTPGANQGVLHTATITQIDNVDNKCPSSKTYKAQGNKNFDIHCGQLNSGTNITYIHTQNITACMDACATNDKGCIGVVFDSALQSGFKNCALQNSTNTVSDRAAATWASLSGSAAPSGGSSLNNGGANSSDSSSSSKAWIAGPVIGGIAALGLIGFAIFWFRRRKAHAAGAAPQEKDGHEFGHYGPAPAYSPGGHDQQHAQYFDAPRGEMGAPPAAMELSGNDHLRNELPASTKYAHAHEKPTAHELPS